MDKQRDVPVPVISPVVLRFFSRYVHWFVRKNMHAVRLARPLPPATEDPLVVYLNHPSWWDPMIAMVLSKRCFSDREHFAPIERAALEKYGIFRKVGFYPVDPGSRAGGLEFLRVSRKLLSRPGTAIWITGSGRFDDPRSRPVALKDGLGHLAATLERGIFLPLALELPFWEERFPEALCRFGEPIDVREAKRRPREWTFRFERALETAQDRLAEDAVTRREEAFETVLSGNVGVGGTYDVWRRIKAAFRGEKFVREHGEIGR